MSEFSLQQIKTALQRLHGRLGPRYAGSFYSGYETRTEPATYHWDGLKRGGNPRHPSIVFQYTLAGWGCYADRTGVKKIESATAFFATVPSPHRYYLPPESPRWSFFWIQIVHPYVVRRIIEFTKHSGPVMAMEPNSAAVVLAIKLITAAFRDETEVEQTLFEFLFASQRLAMETACHGWTYRAAMSCRVFAQGIRSLSIYDQLGANQASEGMVLS